MTDFTDAPLSELSASHDQDCQQAQRSLLPDLCGELDEASSFALAMHLRSCRRCLDSWLVIQTAAELASSLECREAPTGDGVVTN